MNSLQVSRTAQSEQRIAFICDIAEENNCIAFVLEPLRGNVLWFFDEADHCDSRRRVNRPGRTLIVETHIAAGHGCVESATSFSQSTNGFFQLPENFRVVRITEV